MFLEVILIQAIIPLSLVGNYSGFGVFLLSTNLLFYEMKDKSSFILYTDLIHTVKKMPRDKAGELFVHILEYVNDLNPKTKDILIELTFEPIKQQLKRDLEKWNGIKDSRSKAGLASAKSRKKPTKATSVKSVEQKQHKATHSTVSVNDSVNVSVSDSVNGNVTVKKKKDISSKYGHPEINELMSYFKNKVLLDLTITQNRNYCSNLLKKLKKEFPGADAVASIKQIIDVGLEDKFHSKNLTNFKYLYYNVSKLINIGKEKKRDQAPDFIAERKRRANSSI